MPRPFQIFSQSDYLIQIVDINSHTELQTIQIQYSVFSFDKYVHFFLLNIVKLQMQISILADILIFDVPQKSMKNPYEYLSLEPGTAVF